MRSWGRKAAQFFWESGQFFYFWTKTKKNTFYDVFLGPFLGAKLSVRKYGCAKEFAFRKSVPTLIQFYVHKTSIVKFTFNKNAGERLAPDTHITAASWKRSPACPGSAHTSCLWFWTLTQHSVTAGSYSKCMWQATRDGILGGRPCLVLVALENNFIL